MCDNCAEARKHAEQVASDMSRAEKSREFYRRQGECRERERIIKLLEEEIATCQENNLDENGFRQFDWQTYWDVRIQEFEVAIALIKGGK